MRLVKVFTALCLVACAGLFAGNSVYAQGEVVLDSFTIGNLADDIGLTPDASNTFNITEDLGERAGTNLFHSFYSFNIEDGETALFTGDPSITSVISRVTGASASLIDGTLRSEIEGAGFWFVNPTGLILGPNSAIDVGGAFNMGSADFISFSDGLHFSTIDDSVTLSVASARAFGFLENGGGAGVLTLNSVELGGAPVPDEFESYDGLLYAGREVSIADSTVRTLGEGVARGDIEVTGGQIALNNSRLLTTTTSDADAGAITLSANSVTLEGSELRSTVEGDNITGNAGPISISGSEGVTSRSIPAVNNLGQEFTKFSFIDSTSVGKESGAAGDVTIRGGNIILSDTFVFSAIGSDSNQNTANEILLDASNGDLTLENSGINSDTSGVSDAGSITLLGTNIELNGSFLTSMTEDQQAGVGSGSAGSITITGTTSVSAKSIESGIREWSITTASQLLGSGQAGNLTIRGGEINLRDGQIRSFTDSTVPGQTPAFVLIDAGGNNLRLANVELESSTRGTNDAGSITLNGASVILTGSVLSSDSSPIMYPTICGEGVFCTELTGAAGEIAIRGDVVSLVDTTVAATTQSLIPDNPEGTIDIVASAGELSLSGSNITSTTTGLSAAGLINLDGITLRVEDATFNSTSGESDSGSAGIIELNGIESVDISRSTFATETMSDIRGNEAGWIKIETTGDLRLEDSILTATTLGQSNAGFIDLDGTTIRLIGATLETTSATNVSGAAGVIDIDATSLIELISSSIGTDTDSNAPALEPDPDTGEQSELVGWININVMGGDLITDDSTLTATTSGSSGAGFIDLNVGSLQLLNASVVSTEASGIGEDAGDSGVITVIVVNDATIQGSPTTFSGVRTDAAESEGGNILLDVGGQLEIDAGLIEANAGADGTGGSVTITAGDVLMQESGILARAEDGDGGPIFLTVTGADQLFVIGSESLINADSNTGTAGEIDINAPDVDLDSALQEQDANIVAAPELAADACSPSASGEQSTFVQTDEGGTPLAPDRYLTANAQTSVSAVAASPPDKPYSNSSGFLAAVQSNPAEACR